MTSPENESAYLNEPRKFTFTGLLNHIVGQLIALNDQQLLQFAVAVTARLHSKYQTAFDSLDYEGLAAVADSAITFMKTLPNRETNVDQVTDFTERIGEMMDEAYDDFDEQETGDSGVLRTIECLESLLGYVSTGNRTLINRVVEAPFDVIDIIMTNELELDTNDPGKHINHPLMKEEINFQLNEIQRLKG